MICGVVNTMELSFGKTTWNGMVCSFFGIGLTVLRVATFTLVSGAEVGFLQGGRVQLLKVTQDTTKPADHKIL
jgi:hypothetical protein